MSEGEANKEARTILAMRETAQALGLAYLSDGQVDGWEHYKYEPWQMSLLVEAWAPIIQGLNFRVNKWVRVFYAEGVASGPMFLTALKNRKLRLENEALKEEIRQMQRQQAAATAPAPAPAAPPGSILVTPPAKPAFDRLNYDSKRMWAVDDNGFFERDHNGDYIPQLKRREKPILKPEVYQRLIKWNSKERVDKIFNV